MSLMARWTQKRQGSTLAAARLRFETSLTPSRCWCWAPRFNFVQQIQPLLVACRHGDGYSSPRNHSWPPQRSPKVLRASFRANPCGRGPFTQQRTRDEHGASRNGTSGSKTHQSIELERFHRGAPGGIPVRYVVPVDRSTSSRLPVPKITSAIG